MRQDILTPWHHNLCLLCPPQAMGCATPYTLELAPASGVVTVDTAAWPAEGVQPAGNFTVQPADASQGLVIVDVQVSCRTGAHYRAEQVGGHAAPCALRTRLDT
jgi:hypothetical protein